MNMMEKLDELDTAAKNAAVFAPFNQAEYDKTLMEFMLRNQRAGNPGVTYADIFRAGKIAGLRETAGKHTDSALDAALHDAIAEPLSSLYYCGRAWSAWSYGTMTEDDFAIAGQSAECITNVLDAVNPFISTLQARIAMLTEALQYYADGHHFIKADEDAWDTVSGEPINFQCDEAGTATIEDGSVAKMALAGTPVKDGEE